MTALHWLLLVPVLLSVFVLGALWARGRQIKSGDID